MATNYESIVGVEDWARYLGIRKLEQSGFILADYQVEFVNLVNERIEQFKQAESVTQLPIDDKLMNDAVNAYFELDTKVSALTLNSYMAGWGLGKPVINPVDIFSSSRALGKYAITEFPLVEQEQDVLVNQVDSVTVNQVDSDRPPHVGDDVFILVGEYKGRKGIIKSYIHSVEKYLIDVDANWGKPVGYFLGDFKIICPNQIDSSVNLESHLTADVVKQANNILDSISFLKGFSVQPNNVFLTNAYNEILKFQNQQLDSLRECCK